MKSTGWFLFKNVSVSSAQKLSYHHDSFFIQSPPVECPPLPPPSCMNDNTQRGNPVIKTYATKVGAMLLETRFDSFEHILKKSLDAYSIAREREGEGWHFSGREISLH